MTIQTRMLVAFAIVVAAGAALIAYGLFGVSGPDALRAGFDHEFLTRPDGYAGVREAYGFSFARPPLQMDPGLMYRAVAGGSVDVICAFATDGRIPAYDLVMLEDDKGFFPPYFAAPVIRAATLRQHPELEAVLNRLAGRIDDKTMQAMNFEVDDNQRPAAEVAREFLVAQGLIGENDENGSGDAGSVAVGSKNFTEQRILGELLAILIETQTDLSVRRRLNLGGTMICFGALRGGDLDLYAEYTGTGLVNILNEEAIADAEAAYARVREAFAEQFDLVWLEPLGFNNTYTLTMRRQHADDLDIETISDLADYLNRK